MCRTTDQSDGIYNSYNTVVRDFGHDHLPVYAASAIIIVFNLIIFWPTRPLTITINIHTSLAKNTDLFTESVCLITLPWI